MNAAMEEMHNLRGKTAVVIGGVGTLLITGAWMKLFPTLRDRDQLHRDLE